MTRRPSSSLSEGDHSFARNWRQSLFRPTSPSPSSALTPPSSSPFIKGDSFSALPSVHPILHNGQGAQTKKVIRWRVLLWITPLSFNFPLNNMYRSDCDWRPQPKWRREFGRAARLPNGPLTKGISQSRQKPSEAVLWLSGLSEHGSKFFFKVRDRFLFVVAG